MKKILVVLIVLGALFLVPNVTKAVPTSTFTATEPTEYTDGTTIPVEDVLTFLVYCGGTSGSRTFSYSVPDLDSISIDVGTCVQGQVGTYYFVATATSTVHGTESVYSNEITRTYIITDIPKTPNAPTLFTVG